MYIPNQFKQHNFDEIKWLMEEFPLATLIAHSAEKLEVSHIPLYFEEASETPNGSEYGFLYGHIAKVNPLSKMPVESHWQVIFCDMGHYISPNWYPNKAVTHKEVPTWNYRSVHLTVKPTFITDPLALRQMVGKLSDINEINQPVPWSLDEAPDDFVKGLCKAIVGIKFEIIDVNAQFKLSQNKDKETKANIVQNLRQLNTNASQRMASQIEKAAEK